MGKLEDIPEYFCATTVQVKSQNPLTAKFLDYKVGTSKMITGSNLLII